MADRLSLIMQLGALATDAAQRGDDRAAQTCRDAAELLFADKSAVDFVDERRRHDRERKPALKPRIPRKSTESADFQSAPSVFPHTPFPTPPDTTTTTPREVISGDEEMVEMLTGEVAKRMGEYAKDADEFVKRREYTTWKAWLKEILTSLTGGSALPADVAQVCRDDAALVRPIGSPKGFRTFIGSAVLERQSRERGSTAKPGAGTDVFAQIRALVRTNADPRQGNTRFIPLAEVEKLGPDALRAYQAIGGAARVLAAVQKPETIGFLAREFSDHYTQRGAA